MRSPPSSESSRTSFTCVFDTAAVGRRDSDAAKRLREAVVVVRRVWLELLWVSWRWFVACDRGRRGASLKGSWGRICGGMVDVMMFVWLSDDT